MRLVSIVVPTYNRFGFLRCALQSALSQTYPNIEIIVTDDASEADRSAQDAYMESVIAEHKNVSYIQNKSNQGFVKNLNIGLSNASGAYLAILFDDDYLDPLYVQSAVEVLERHSDVAFVSLGAYNELQDGTKTKYVPRACGKMSKYTYMNYLDYRRHNGTICWSVSPGNHVFRRSPDHMFRTELYQGWNDRQLRRGSGYDILFILDAFKIGATCYHLPDHLCTFRSHDTSATVMNLDQVVSDTKKGIDRYFEEDPCYVSVEIDRYLQEHVLQGYNPNTEAYIRGVLGVLERQGMALCEFAPVFFNNGFYNCPLEVVIDKAGAPADTAAYDAEALSFCRANPGTVPTLSFLRYMKHSGKSDIEGYKRHLEGLLGCVVQATPGAAALAEFERAAARSDHYRAVHAPTFKNIVRVYWHDIVERHMKTVALASLSGHAKYARAIMSGSQHPPSPRAQARGWVQAYIRHTHSVPKDASPMSSEEIYRSNEFRLLNRMPKSYKLMDFETYVRLADRAWDIVPIPLVYKDIKILEGLPEQRWLSYIQGLDYGSPLYNRAKDIYHTNEIVGEDMTFAFQLSGHLRFYKRLHASLEALRSLVNTETYMFIWNDGMGFKKTTFEEEDISGEIQNALALFSPRAHLVQSNGDYMKTSLYFTGITFVEYNGCSYPQLKSQYYSVHSANELRRSSGQHYDMVFKLRMDAELDKEIKQGSLFEMYFCTNFKGFLFVSFETDHGHTGGYTGCDLCNKAYYTYRHPTKHYGEHSNDICDFLAISSPETMDRYANIYKVFEELYLDYNVNTYQKVHALSNKIADGVNTFLPERYQDLYRRKIISPEMTTEYRFGTDVPLYPEAFLRIYLKDYVVVSNRHFRFRFNWKT